MNKMLLQTLYSLGRYSKGHTIREWKVTGDRQAPVRAQKGET